MADFDPYFKWLAIPPEEQPANHYRLLALPLFESDADVIDAAAEQRTVFLRSFQTGPNAELAERLLNEVSEARVCLLDGKSKARYDTQLRAKLEPVPEDDPPGVTPEELAPVASRASTRQRSRGGKPFWQEPWAMPAAAGGIVVVLLLIMMLFGSGEEPQEPANQSTNTTPGNQQKAQPTASKETLPAKAATPPLAVAPFDAAQAKAHQQGWSKYLGVPVEYTNSIGMKLTLIPPGEFMMGSNEFEENEKPVHKVTLTSPFQLGVCEVTQEQYAKVVGDNPSKFKGSTNPVERVSWTDAMAFCSLLTDRPEEKLAGRRYRLPTEAEWEYSCRAGTTTAFSFGSDASLLGEFSWYTGNSGKQTHPVGQKRPNSWGLYDMYGNVWERCRDIRADYSSASVKDPEGPASGGLRVIRGGSWGLDGPTGCRSAYRNGAGLLSGNEYVGFRVVLEIPVDENHFREISRERRDKVSSLPIPYAYIDFSEENLMQHVGGKIELNNSAKVPIALDGVQIALESSGFVGNFSRPTARIDLGTTAFDKLTFLARVFPVDKSNLCGIFSIGYKRAGTCGVTLNKNTWSTNDHKYGLFPVVDGKAAANLSVSSFRLNPHKWYHVGFSIDTIAKEQILYLDGAVISKSRADDKLKLTGPVRLGNWMDDNPNHAFLGRMDDIYVFDTVLSDTDIKKLYDQSK